MPGWPGTQPLHENSPGSPPSVKIFIGPLAVVCQTGKASFPSTLLRLEARMSVSCPECGSTSVRQAHFRFSDAIYLLALQYPVRCRSCRKRWYLPLSEARRLPRSPVRRRVIEKEPTSR